MVVKHKQGYIFNETVFNFYNINHVIQIWKGLCALLRGVK